MFKVTIIVPGYNAELYIEQCLESLLAQTLEEIQIVCVNDGSSDKTLDIMNQFALNDSRIVVVDKKNGGLSTARNAGMQRAEGEYILFLDSDDYLDKEAAEVLYKKAAAQNLDVLFYSAQSFFESDELYKLHKNYETYYDRKENYSAIYTGREIYTLFMKNGDFKSSACLQLLKREMLMQNHIYFYEGIIHEDQIYTANVLKEAKRVSCIENKFYFRRVRENSIMTKEKGIPNIIGYFTAIQELLNIAHGLKAESEQEYILSIASHINTLSKTIGKWIHNIPKEEFQEIISDIPVREKFYYSILLENQLKYLESMDKKNEKIKNQKVVIENLEKKKIRNILKKIIRKIKNFFVK